MRRKSVQAKRAAVGCCRVFSTLACLVLAFFSRTPTGVHFAAACCCFLRAIPAFARKYGLPCSACHTAWPELNNFGQFSATMDISWITSVIRRSGRILPIFRSPSA